MPIEIIRAMAILKRRAAIANNKLGKLSDEKANAIVQAADEILQGNGMTNSRLSSGKQVVVHRLI